MAAVRFLPIWDEKGVDDMARRFGLRTRFTARKYAFLLNRQYGVRLIRIGRRLYVPEADLERLGMQKHPEGVIRNGESAVPGGAPGG